MNNKKETVTEVVSATSGNEFFETHLKPRLINICSEYTDSDEKNRKRMIDLLDEQIALSSNAKVTDFMLSFRAGLLLIE